MEALAGVDCGIKRGANGLGGCLWEGVAGVCKDGLFKVIVPSELLKC